MRSNRTSPLFCAERQKIIDNKKIRIAPAVRISFLSLQEIYKHPSLGGGLGEWLLAATLFLFRLFGDDVVLLQLGDAPALGVAHDEVYALDVGYPFCPVKLFFFVKSNSRKMLQ